MFVSFVLHLVHRLERKRGYAWKPSVDLSDNQVYSALLPHTNY